MTTHSRKTFLQTLGLGAAGALLSTSSAANNFFPHPAPARTEPGILPTAKRAVRLAHLTDIHIKPERIAEYGMAASLNAVNDLSTRVDFIINGGDAIMNNASLSKEIVRDQWKSFHGIMKGDSNLPVYHCVGNHDLFGFLLPSANHAESKKWAMDEYALQRPYYSFTKPGWHFIVLDSIHARNSVPGYFGKLDEEQMEWLKRELKSVPDTTHICIVSHIPIIAICTLFDHDLAHRQKRRISDNTMHADTEELTELFYQHKNVRACISGHTHMIDYVNYMGVEYFCNGAVAGNWWKGNLKHFAPSFSVMNFYEDGTVSREVNYYKWSQ